MRKEVYYSASGKTCGEVRRTHSSSSHSLPFPTLASLRSFGLAAILDFRGFRNPSMPPSDRFCSEIIFLFFL